MSSCRASFLLLLLLGTIQLSAGEEALYGPSDPVVLLNRDNFSSQVHGSPSAWLVEFYSSWCGHCIRFAPTFKEFARKVNGWKDLIRVGVLDCADEMNTGTCRDYDVGGYPTLKFFAPKASNSSKGVERQSYFKTIESLMKDTAEFAASQKELQAFFPKIESGREVATAFDGEHSGAKVAVFLNPHKHKYGPSLFINLKKALGSANVPLFLSSKETILASYLVKGEKILRSLSIQGKDLDEDVKVILKRIQDIHPQETTAHSISSDDVDRRRYRVYMSDLENALNYALKQEVSSHAVISGDKLSALQNFMEILFKYFPGRRDTRIFLGELKAWIFGHDDAIKGAELEAHIKTLSERLGAFKDTPKDWMGCKGSSKMFGGYPCALWTLFHTLTVNHAGVTSDAKATKLDVLNAMHGYVKEYFGCRDCSHNFEKEWQSDLPSNSVFKAEDAIIWLWRTHNKVNNRLSGDPSDDPSFPKARYPDRIHCRECYRQDNDSPDLEQVLRFLKGLYGKNISFAGLSRNTSEQSRPQELSNGGLWFSSTDVSLLMFLHVAAVALIFCVCRKVVFRKKCKLLNSTRFGSHNV